MTMAPTSYLHSFTAWIPTGNLNVTGTAPTNKTMLTPDGLTIDKIIAKNYDMGYGSGTTAIIHKGSYTQYAATIISGMLSLISEHGDGLFEQYDSELTLGFFGM